MAAGVQKMVMRLLVFKVSSELGKGSEADYRAPALTLLAKSLASFLYKHSLDFCKPLVSFQGSEKAGQFPARPWRVDFGKSCSTDLGVLLFLLPFMERGLLHYLAHLFRSLVTLKHSRSVFLFYAVISAHQE